MFRIFYQVTYFVGDLTEQKKRAGSVKQFIATLMEITNAFLQVNCTVLNVCTQAQLNKDRPHFLCTVLYQLFTSRNT